MNFLSHDWLLGKAAPGLAHVGAALPDVWPHLTVRPRPATVLRHLEPSSDPGARALAFGISHHVQTDLAFHGHPSFSARMVRVAERIGPLLDEPRYAHVVAHVLVEMLLDRWLMDREPGLVDDYYRHFSVTRRARACDLTAPDPGVHESLGRVLETFARIRFLEEYTEFEGIARRLVGTLTRVSDRIVCRSRIDSLAEEIHRLHGELEAGSDALLADVHRELHERLRAKGFPAPSAIDDVPSSRRFEGPPAAPAP